MKRKPYLGTIVLGFVSLASYIIVFMNAETVMEYFTRGGKYTILPIICALYFSFVHGGFASNLLDVLGVEAKKAK